MQFNILDITSHITQILIWITTLLLYLHEKRKNKKNLEPEIIAELRSDKAAYFMFVLEITNIGGGIAKNIEFTVIDYPKISTDWCGNDNITDFRFIKTGISYLSKNRSFKTRLVNMYDNLTDEYLMNKSLILQIDWQDRLNKKYSETYELDFEMFHGTEVADSTSISYSNNQKIINELTQLIRVVSKQEIEKIIE